MKKISFVIIILTLFATACTIEEMNFDSTKLLSEWYAETAAMEGTTYWNPIAYPLPVTDGITVSRLTMENGMVIDFYFPAEHMPGDKAPVIISPRSYKMSDEFNRFGRGILTMDYEISWAHLLASEGYAVIKYETNVPSKALEIIITTLNTNSKALGIDTDRIGFWSISSNPQTVLSFLTFGDEKLQAQIKCSVFYSPDLKLKGLIQFSTLHHVPYFIAVGLKDDPVTNKSAKKFADESEKEDLVYEYYEHPEGEHGFDALQDDETTHSIIKSTLDFYKKYLFKEVF